MCDSDESFNAIHWSICVFCFCRYFFKKASDEFDSGVILEEVTDDIAELPLWEGKVVGKVEKVEWVTPHSGFRGSWKVKNSIYGTKEMAQQNNVVAEDRTNEQSLLLKQKNRHTYKGL